MRRNAGMSLVTAVFLLVVLASVGALMFSLSGVQQTESALDIQGTRAYHAARSGLEYGAAQAIAGTSPGPCTTGAGIPTSVALPPANFDAFSAVTVTCTPQGSHDEGNPAQLVNFYLVVADACNQPTGAGICPNPAPGANYVERELQLNVTN
jgi:MSHA biogenesis protein MshP